MTTEADFCAALMNPALPAPAGLTGPNGQPAGNRFDVYRNNVVGSLTRALEAGFPALRAVVGEAFFAAMAGEFLRRHPPQSRLIMLYGSAMPEFLAQFPPVAHLGYLPDLARLELAIRHSYHAADVAPVTADRLAALLPEDLLSARLTFAPPVLVMQSGWPVDAIWRFNTGKTAIAPVMRAEAVLVTRPEFDPVVECLPEGGGATMAALQRGASLGAALDAHPTDAGALLHLLLQGRAITDIVESP